MENVLKRKDRRGQIYDVRSYHDAMTPETRNENLGVFSHGRLADSSNDDVDYELVCTDRAARGVDFEGAPVDHAILFDFPSDPVDYIRRVGRVARAGRDGTCTVFAYGWQLPIARRVMGKQLDESLMAALSNEDEDDGEYRGGVRGRRKNKEKDKMVKGNIEQGKLWQDR